MLLCITLLSLRQIFRRQASSTEWTPKQILYMVKLSFFVPGVSKDWKASGASVEFRWKGYCVMHRCHLVWAVWGTHPSACSPLVCICLCVAIMVQNEPKIELCNSWCRYYCPGHSGSAPLRLSNSSWPVCLSSALVAWGTPQAAFLSRECQRKGKGGNCLAWAASCGNKSSENCNSLCLNVCWGSLKPLVLLSPNCLVRGWGAFLKPQQVRCTEQCA